MAGLATLILWWGYEVMKALRCALKAFLVFPLMQTLFATPQTKKASPVFNG
jgi:hypothetical protein